MKLGSLVSSLGKGAINLSFLPVGAAVGFQTSLRVACHRRPMPMPRQFSSYLEHPLRMRYRNPRALLEQCGIEAGETVLDLGCGVGTFTREIAHMVGEGGTVHAVDIQPSLLAQAENRLTGLVLNGPVLDKQCLDGPVLNGPVLDKQRLDAQVHFHLATAEKLPLPDQSVDMVTLIATIGEVTDPLVAIDEIYRVLKPGGRLVVSEELPDPSYTSARTVRRWLVDGGFEFAGRDGNLFCYFELYLRPLSPAEIA